MDLTYCGGGAYLAHVPAQDLTGAEIAALGRDPGALCASGCYAPAATDAPSLATTIAYYAGETLLGCFTCVNAAVTEAEMRELLGLPDPPPTDPATPADAPAALADPAALTPADPAPAPTLLEEAR
jgi:hypothetical protein